MNIRKIILSLALVAFGSSGFLINAEVNAAEFTAKIGHLESAKQPRHKTLEIVADLVKKRTNGAVEFKLFPSAQLGMHKTQERPIAVNGEVVIKPMMYLALSYDHRIIDGKEAVQFLISIKEALEDPARLLLKV